MDKNSAKIEDFDDSQAEKQTLLMLAGKQVLFDFTQKVSNKIPTEFQQKVF